MCRRQDDAQATITRIEIEEDGISSTNLSLMPEGLEQQIDQQSIVLFEFHEVGIPLQTESAKPAHSTALETHFPLTDFKNVTPMLYLENPDTAWLPGQP